ncbi:hypothetical protein NE236_30080 [Actinoallomurus purpureus]|uniref:hypothetical protein n=1 Tax=Actinoallomurus purpureus TaxID=478114 RepID=UPI0020931C84|nr:hypothetical protein [Actinoallomurus purpureus]MCO6009227.1 hypothetical protein [Actinoallomurus purpureus]
MNLNLSRRVPALLAATALAGGLAAATAGSAFAETNSKTAVKCAKAAGKYHGKLTKSFTIWGRAENTGKPVKVGGHLDVYRSDACKTVWATVVKKSPAYTKRKLETGVDIEWTDRKTGKPKLVSNDKTTTKSVSTPAAHLANKTKFRAEGGFVADLQYIGGGNVVVRYKK